MKRREQVTIGHIWGAIYPALLYLGITIVAGVILMFVAILQGSVTVTNGHVEFNQVGDSFSLIITFFGALMTVPFLILIKYLDSKKQKMMGVRGYKSVFFAKYLLIIPFATTFVYAANMLVQIIEVLIPSIAHSFDDTAQTIYGADITVQIITAVILGPIVEELIFRGLMYARLKRMFGGVVAALVTSLVFGIYHMNISQGIYAFLFSYAAIFIYEKYKKIYAPMIMHMVANGLSVLVTFVLKDYNNQSGAQENALNKPEHLGVLLIVFVICTALCGVFALCIKKCVNPEAK